MTYLVTFFYFLWLVVSVWTVTFIMATGNSTDIDGSGRKTDVMDFASVETDNQFGALEGVSEDNDLWETQERKRKRANTGSVSNETFNSMPSDEKLSAIFAKLVNIEQKQSCIGKLEGLMKSTVNKVGNIH